MKVLIRNKDNLLNSDIDEEIIRARALIINNKNEILLGYMGNMYQFPGGHMEKNETINDTLIREIKEETGIILDEKEYKPFIEIDYYEKNYRKSKKNYLIKFYYFLINYNDKYNPSNMCLDNYEIFFNYQLRYIKLDNIFNELDKSLKNSSNPEVKCIYDDIKDVINYYFEKYK